MSDIILGYQQTPHGNAQPIRIKSADRRGHTYLIGKTGTGKSTLAANMIINDNRAGAGVDVTAAMALSAIIAYMAVWTVSRSGVKRFGWYQSLGKLMIRGTIIAASAKRPTRVPNAINTHIRTGLLLRWRVRVAPPDCSPH